jgi:eukaryotic-like serine/threonine-protein kinase
MIGRSIAHYEVTERIGAGGMGEVYRARDTRLGRSVALKVLPEVFSRDPERLMRFEREARLLASLNHAGIATIHGIETDGEQRVLVMELVEGEDLARRIARGPIPVDEAIGIARQIADAVEAAHEQGVVHRDLKPANIIVSPDGNVKVLDFGLAKAIEGDGSNSGLSQSPTMLNSSPTAAGVILGTAAYMSPEQARGRRVDRRADVFAFGCVFYEMLTGRQAFRGETVSDTLAAVLRAEPDWSQLPAATPERVRTLLRRCLEKDPRQRLRDMGEARIALDAVIRDEPDAPVAIATTTTRGVRPWTIWLLAALLALAAGGWVLTARRSGGGEQPLLRASIIVPAKTPISLQGAHPGPPAISPDGHSVAFALDTPEGTRLAVRELSRDEIRILTGTDGAGYPFWSPDSREIGFFAQGKLKRVEISGGTPVVIADAEIGKGGTWNHDGTIVYAPSFGTAIFKVPAAGGTPVAITVLDTTRHESSHRFPRFLPDEKHFLYVVRRFGGEDAGHTLRVGSIDGEPEHEIFATQSDAMFADGYLFFIRDGALTAQAFDPKTMALSGDPVMVAPKVRILTGAAHGVFDVSPSGIAVYQAGGASTGGTLYLVDTAGKELGALGGTENYAAGFRISPDGRTVACAMFDAVGGTPDLWLVDMTRGTKTRFTFGPSNDNNPAWSPDGSRIAYSSNQDGHFDIFIKRVVGSEKETRTVATDHDIFLALWTPDGRYVLGHELGAGGQGQLRAFPIAGTGPDPLAGANLPRSLGGVMGLYRISLSPDGRWLAFESAEGGREEIYAIPFGSTGRRWQITLSGGTNPHWVGRHVYFEKDREIWRASVTPSEAGLVIGDEQRIYAGQWADDFDVTSDETRMVVLRGTRGEDTTPLSLITNWRSLLDGRGAAH